MGVGSLQQAIRVSGGILRSHRPADELVRRGDVYGLLLKNEIGDITDRLLPRLGISALTALVFSSDWIKNSFNNPEYKTYGHLDMKLKHDGETRIMGEDSYAELLRRCPHIELHYYGSHQDIACLPSALGKAARFLERKGTACNYPYVIGITNQEMAYFAKRQGMDIHEVRQPRTVSRQAQALYDVRRAARGKAPKTMVTMGVSLPTTEFISLAKRICRDGLR